MKLITSTLLCLAAMAVLNQAAPIRPIGQVAAFPQTDTEPFDLNNIFDDYPDLSSTYDQAPAPGPVASVLPTFSGAPASVSEADLASASSDGAKVFATSDSGASPAEAPVSSALPVLASSGSPAPSLEDNAVDQAEGPAPAVTNLNSLVNLPKPVLGAESATEERSSELPSLEKVLITKKPSVFLHSRRHSLSRKFIATKSASVPAPGLGPEAVSAPEALPVLGAPTSIFATIDSADSPAPAPADSPADSPAALPTVTESIGELVSNRLPVLDSSSVSFAAVKSADSPVLAPALAPVGAPDADALPVLSSANVQFTSVDTAASPVSAPADAPDSLPVLGALGAPIQFV